jgi:UDPglucose 6-dehydrogenase
LRDKKIAVWGLTFKPNTDDCRDSPALALVDALERSGAKVVAYDPAVAPWAAFQRPNLVCATTPYEVAHRADALIIATDWDCFHHLDFARIRETMRTAVIVDGRNCLDATSLRQQGFIYLGVGRPDAAIRVSPVPKASSAA